MAIGQRGGVALCGWCIELYEARDMRRFPTAMDPGGSLPCMPLPRVTLEAIRLAVDHSRSERAPAREKGTP